MTKLLPSWNFLNNQTEVGNTMEKLVLARRNFRRKKQAPEYRVLQCEDSNRKMKL